MEVYKGTITDFNNEELRDKFFMTPIVAQIWNKIAPMMTLQDCFKEKKAQYEPCDAFQEITRIMRHRYHLEMSGEWN